MGLNCRVCNTELKQKYNECPYCGYSNKVVLTVANDDSAEYKLNLLKSITNISIRENIFQYNEERSTMEMVGELDLFDEDLDGVQCSEQEVVSDEWIAHFTGEQELTINYSVGGKPKSIITSIEINEDDSNSTFDISEVGEWHLALYIDEELRLMIGIELWETEDDEEYDIWWLNTVELDLTA